MKIESISKCCGANAIIDGVEMRCSKCGNIFIASEEKVLLGLEDVPVSQEWLDYFNKKQ